MSSDPVLRYLARLRSWEPSDDLAQRIDDLESEYLELRCLEAERLLDDDG